MHHKKNSDILSRGLSVIIPTFNGSQWLPQTIDHIQKALRKASVTKYEIIVVDDGSTDDTVEVVKNFSRLNEPKLRVYSQQNSGRFIARDTGTKQAKFPYLLFVDTRVFIGESSLEYLINQHMKDESRSVWCAHVRVEKNGNVYARFWEAIAYVAWRNYFRKPRDISYGIKEFDKYPKGTTCFFVSKGVLESSNKWFLSNTKDLSTSNDDTLLIRHIASKNSINISPQYWCLYHARGKFVPYCKHVFHRGKVFVDGFLRRDGNVYFWPLIGFLFISLSALLLLIFLPRLASLVLLVLFSGWLLELVILALLRVPYKDGLSLWLLSPVFGFFYGAGIWSAFLRIYGPGKFWRKFKQ